MTGRRMSVGKKKLLSKVRSESKKTKKELTQQMKSSQFWTEVFKTLALIGFYYFSSIGLTFYQSWLLKVCLNTVKDNIKLFCFTPCRGFSSR